jgi:hypothetical protein
MNAKEQFIKMYKSLPDKAKTELVCNYPENPMTLTVCKFEIEYNTELGKKILKDLGYEDE